uniref:Cyclic nucleotide-binding domain-containing protein n=1 Tax=Trichobilharzia regenti TaxID=157069 RepID=A0AA85KKC2_TRIRE|nr:unnamed protein product [Trichobilharzia regenti]
MRFIINQEGDQENDGDVDEFLNIEFHADHSHPSRRHLTSIDRSTLRRRSQRKKESYSEINNDPIEDTLSSRMNDIQISKKDVKGQSDHARQEDTFLRSAQTVSSPTSSLSRFSSCDNLSHTDEYLDETDSSDKLKRNLGKKIPPIKALKRILIAGLLLRATLNLIRPIQELRDAKLRSKNAQTFVELQKDIEDRLSSEQLGFNKYDFKINREKHLTHDAVKILTIPSSYRTESMIHTALVAVTATVEAFSEFPIAMQNAIIRNAWYEKYEARRMIIRQGQPPLNFYFIVSGTVVVSVSRKNKQTGEPFEETVSILKAGQSFGELALIYRSNRSATIICKTSVELLVMSQDEFNKIFLQNSHDKEAEHISFLRTISFIPYQVIDQLSSADGSVLLFTYFRRNMTICMDSNQSNWIYIVKTGQCRILKGIELKAKCGNSTSGKGGRPETRVQYYYCKSNNIRSKRSKSTTIQNSRKQSNSKDNKIFIELKTLEPNSVFGLESIVFEPFGGTTSVSLVSDGAECVAISKKFFIEHCPTNFMNWLRSKVQPFPKVEELESKLSIYREWKLYRNRLLEESTHQLRDS